tara:strand:- start:2048 stop:2917 length:870 start_codon:yes stop_codon:yes gene_type:complete
VLGIFAALGAAFSWTYACFIWKEQTKYLSIIEINLIKNLIAFFIFSPLLIRFNIFSDLRNIAILLLSGVIGIALGDSLYIAALKRIGTRKTLTIEAMSPVIANILGSVFIEESISYRLWIGTFIVIISLIIIIRQRNPEDKNKVIGIKKHKEGVLIAFLSVICAVFAAILSRLVLTNSTLSPFETTEIRLLGSLLALAPIIRIKPESLIKNIPTQIKLKFIFGSLLGTNIGILLQQTVFKVLPIGIGWTLLSTSPLISLFFAKSEGDKINHITILMTVTTLIGIGIIFT